MNDFYEKPGFILKLGAPFKGLWLDTHKLPRDITTLSCLLHCYILTEARKHISIFRDISDCVSNTFMCKIK